MIEYEIIQAMYGELRAKRSKLPYMRHIDQGLVLLRAMEVSERVLRAWCIHPVFQLDDFFVPMLGVRLPSYEGKRVLRLLQWEVVALAMEYRHSANSYLTKSDRIQTYPRLSPVLEVNFMLTVDKVQNYRDARIHLYPHIADSERWPLDTYFKTWLDMLKVSQTELNYFEKLLAQNDKENPL